MNVKPVEEQLSSEGWPKEKPHPMRKVPGYPREAKWDSYLGRWVIYRKTS